MKKLLAIVLLLAGLVGLGTGGWLYVDNENQVRCDRDHLEAIAILERAAAVEGTPQEAELMEQAKIESDNADFACRAANDTRMGGMLVMGGGLVLLLGGVFVLRRKAAKPAAV